MAEPVDLFANFGPNLNAIVTEAARNGPLLTEKTTGATVILRHHDLEELAHDTRLHGIGLNLFDLMGIDDGPLRDWYGGLMFTNDGAAHRRLRSLVSRAFTPHAVENLRATAATLAEEAADPLSRAGGGDLVEANRLLAMRVMCRLLGVPDADVDVFGGWADDLSPVFFVMTPEQIAAATAAIVALIDHVDHLVVRRRADPGPDLITALLAVEDAGDHLSHQQLVAMVANLLVGGHDTTTSQIGCSLLTLLTHPDAAAAARRHPELLASVTAETVRFETSLPLIPRTAAAPIEVAGTELPAGTMVMLCSPAANRDPAVWKDPDQFVAGRFAEPGAPRLLSFGAGPHYCLGAALARLTLEECLWATLQAAPEVTLDADPATLPWRVVLGRSPVRLPVTLSG